MGTYGTLIQGDCFDVLPTLANESIDFVCTSPPYDAIRDYNGFPVLDKSKRIELGRELHRVCKDGSICAVVIQDQIRNFAQSLTSFRWAVEWCESADWRLFQTVIYQRHGLPGRKPGFRPDHEYVFLFLKGDRPAVIQRDHLTVPTKTAGKEFSKFRHLSSGRQMDPGTAIIADHKCRGTVWHYAASCTEGNRLKTQHPATMPDALVKDLVLCFSREGETVLDPFAGSGTTCVVSQNHRRRYVGIELSDNYAAIARKRLSVEGYRDIFAEAEAA